MPTNDEAYGVYGAKMDCKCPRCGRIYKRQIHWIGRGIPRKMCVACADYLADRNFEEYQTHGGRAAIWASGNQAGHARSY